MEQAEAVMGDMFDLALPISPGSEESLDCLAPVVFKALSMTLQSDSSPSSDTCASSSSEATSSYHGTSFGEASPGFTSSQDSDGQHCFTDLLVHSTRDSKSPSNNLLPRLASELSLHHAANTMTNGLSPSPGSASSSQSPVATIDLTTEDSQLDTSNSGKKSETVEKPKKKHRKNKPPDADMLPPCRVCGEKASGLHYGANTCEPCKVTF